MKHLKKFEKLTFDTKEIEYIEDPKSNSNKKIYYFETDGIEYRVIFSRAFIDYYDNVWSRDYENTELDGIGIGPVNKNPLNIVSAVSFITQEFIKEMNPEAISILHINMPSERPSILNLNKRAKINYQYLSKIDGYKTYYSSQSSKKNPNISFGTSCILYKNGFDISQIINHWKKTPWQHHKIEVNGNSN